MTRKMSDWQNAKIPTMRIADEDRGSWKPSEASFGAATLPLSICGRPMRPASTARMACELVTSKI
jgi:hypothetical protein